MEATDYAELRRLAVFALVVELGSFSSAAARLLTSRSRVSEQVSALEASLGVRLLQRSTRRLALTDEGQRVYGHAKGLHGLLEVVIAEAEQDTVRGRVRVTATHDTAFRRLTPHLASFERRYPDVHVDLWLSDERLDLIAHEVDIAVRVGLPRDESLIGRHLHEERPLIVASEGYLARNGTPQTVADLVEHRWVLIHQINAREQVALYPTDERVTSSQRPTHLCRPGHFHVTNAPLMAQQMVLEGMGLAVLLPATVSEFLDAGVLRIVMPEWGGLPLTFALVYPSRRHVPARVRCLIDHLLQARIFAPPSFG